MSTRARCILSIIVFASVSLIYFLGSTPTVADAGTSTSFSKIKHVVIIFQENRTPDNLFQDPVLISRGADIASSGINSSGQTVKLTPMDLGSNGSTPDTYDVGHGHDSFKQMCHFNPATGKCAMDGADLEVVICPAGISTCAPPNAPFRYVKPADVAPYFEMAERYTFADRMFQTNQGPSFPAHMFILSGTSQPAVGSDLFVADNPAGSANAMSISGCIAPALQHVRAIDPAGVYSKIYPCVEENTLTDLLDVAGRSWRYYAPTEGYIWTSPTAIRHMCVPNSASSGKACTGPDYTAQSPKVVLNQTQSNSQFLTDVANGNLPDVSWVIPAAQFSDHASMNTGCGPSWVTQLVNAVGKSPYWNDTAIIVTWDDWGGWYDHVPPFKMLNSYEYGFRVPMMVIAPYGKRNYISHAVHDFGSILKFTEEVFNLPSLNKADARADDLADFFNFSLTAPHAFESITPPANAASCIADTSAPAGPDMDDDED